MVNKRVKKEVQMKKENLRMFYYIAWAVGLIAAAILVYGIIKALI